MQFGVTLGVVCGFKQWQKEVVQHLLVIAHQSVGLVHITVNRDQHIGQYSTVGLLLGNTHAHVSWYSY